MAKSLVALGTAAAIGVAALTTPTPAAAQAWLAPVIVGSVLTGAFVGAAAASPHYYDPYYEQYAEPYYEQYAQPYYEQYTEPYEQYAQPYYEQYTEPYEQYTEPYYQRYARPYYQGYARPYYQRYARPYYQDTRGPITSDTRGPTTSDMHSPTTSDTGRLCVIPSVRPPVIAPTTGADDDRPTLPWPWACRKIRRKTTTSEAVSVDGLFILKAQVQYPLLAQTDIRLTPANVRYWG